LSNSHVLFVPAVAQRSELLLCD